MSAQTIAHWATVLSAGPANEAAQMLTFQIIVNQPSLFAVLPRIDAAGNLTFTPALNAAGTAIVTVAVHDDGGTAGGGVDTSPPQTFAINIAKLHPEHNAIQPMDVNGDKQVAAGDALNIINFINAFGSSPSNKENVPLSAYLDVNGDGFISPNDALDVINYLNAFGSSGGTTLSAAAATQPSAASQPSEDLIALLALDPGQQAKPRRSP